jgi:spermidine synthase
MLSCFFGIGLGFLISSKRRLLIGLFAPMFVVQFLLFDFISSSPVRWLLINPVVEQSTMGLSVVDNLYQWVFVLVFIGLVFVFNAMTFMVVGQLVARLMRFEGGLRSYGLNLVGSVLGIVLFYLVSFLWFPPQVWILIMLCILLVFLVENSAAMVVAVSSVSVLLVFMYFPKTVGVEKIYSPYQVLSIVSGDKYIEVAANNTFFQRMLDLRESVVGEDEKMKFWAEYYNSPYKYRENVGDVLVVGSGTGNDVAAAVRAGARSIDAVEIDPAVVEVGRKMHPEQPYSSEKVGVFIEDARGYLNKTQKKYDLIVYGLLDSHTLLSGKSSVRLDSFVYTVEGFQAARDKLKEGGLLSVAFAGESKVFAKKLVLMIEKAFDGKTPYVFFRNGTNLVIGENVYVGSGNDFEAFVNVSGEVQDVDYEVSRSTDDWPFFYMPKRSFPKSIVMMVGVVMVASLVFVRNLNNLIVKKLEVVPFLLGVGFMLIETRSITEISLYFGSNWQVVGVVVVGVLAMAFLANLVAEKIKFSDKWVYVLLFLSLLISRLHFFGDLEEVIVKGVAVLLVSSPLFFSGLLFSKEIGRGKDIGVVMSSNLFGSLVGGLLENSSMYFGILFLHFLAGFVYLAAMLLSVFRKT